MALTGEDLEILRRIVNSRSPDLLGAFENLMIEGQKLVESKRAALQQVILEEMYEKGLEQNDEPNEYGKQLDEIISRLQYQ